MNKFRRMGLIDYNGRIEVHRSLLNVVLHEIPELKEEADREVNQIRKPNKDTEGATE